MEKTLRNVVLFVFLSLVLFACGGGGGGGGSNSISAKSPKDTLDVVAQASGLHGNAIVPSYFVDTAQRKYANLFSDNAFLDKLHNSLLKATEVSVTDNSAVFRSTFVDNGATLTYFIYLVKVSGGNWKIDEF